MSDVFPPSIVPGREPGDPAALTACADVAVAFCELLDAGDVGAAFELHDPALAFFPPGAPAPLDRAAARAAGERMVHAYPGRRTQHVMGNFIASQAGRDRVEAQYTVTVYELTRQGAGGAEELRTPVVFAIAHERAVFARGEDGRWRYVEQRMIPVAPRNPFDGAAA
ncbi:hypothetical protein [Microbacterium sp.]|uniref:hypothetical protein n=1 Tax=Microbacterium sp. TaxID=51671 RepID=UPI0009273813|nr:hypothetical protein [Microbacterium sp.]MBN9192013.1 hypothetical protein [Microbacterium sp.]OJU58273.1 MAG: hypothetical protein BGO04_02020 [Microbacterium sp. 70-38]